MAEAKMIKRGTCSGGGVVRGGGEVWNVAGWCC